MKAILVAALWINLLGCFTSSIHALEGDGNSPISVPISFIRQDNSAIPITGDDACHMVSKFKTDVNLPDTATFDGPPGTTPDPDTFRVEVSGIAAGLAPSIHLSVSRGGVTLYSHDFSMVSGTVGGVVKYRTAEHIRLVSNDVDNVYRAHQTFLVKLGDTVRATLDLPGATGSVELPVGRPFSENGSKAIRTANINFTKLNGVTATTDPQAAIDRICENWAQLGIRCTLSNQQTLAKVNNILHISGSANAAGQLKVKIVNNQTSGAGVNITANIANGDSPEQMAAKLRDAIIAQGLNNVASYDHDQDALVLVGKGQNASFFNIESTVTSVQFVEPPLVTMDDVTTLEGAMLALNFRDSDPTTIELIAVQPVGIGGNGAFAASVGDQLGAVYAGWKNLIIAKGISATLAPPQYPMVLGHEFGHVIMNDYSNVQHHPDTTNLLYYLASEDVSNGAKAYKGAKRLTAGGTPPDGNQNERARNESGPTSSAPILLKKQ
jgi:hypothetical protein